MTYNLTFKTFQMAKKILQRQLDRKTKADVIVRMASNSVSIAKTVNDHAEKQRKEAQDKYWKSNSAFHEVLQKAVGLGYSFEEAKDQLGGAKLNLRLAKDRLLVAQAAKAAADKVTAIVAMESAALPKDPNAFNGCDQGAYPTMMGTVPIKQKDLWGFKLQSNQVILFGDCTIKPEGLEVGDVISY